MLLEAQYESSKDANFSNPHPDRELQQRVTTFLSSRHQPGLRLLQVEARSGVVTLKGRVSTFYEKQLSTQLARRVAGVVLLVDKVVVRQAAAIRRQTAGRSA